MNDINVRCWSDMRQFGFDLLTGESCAYSMRGLFGLTEKGKQLLEKFFSCTFNSEPWNSRACGEEAVASAMLAIRGDLMGELAAFALAEASYPYVAIVRDAVWGCSVFGTEDKERFERARKWWPRCRVIQAMPGSENGRMRHAMSGRLA